MWFRKKKVRCLIGSILMFILNTTFSFAVEATSYYRLVEENLYFFDQYTKFEKYKGIYKLSDFSKDYDIYTFDDGCFNISKCLTVIVHNTMKKTVVLEAFLYNNYVKYGETREVLGTKFDLVSFMREKEKSQLILLSSGRVIVLGEK
jgi:hypothetical protein